MKALTNSSVQISTCGTCKMRINYFLRVGVELHKYFKDKLPGFYSVLRTTCGRAAHNYKLQKCSENTTDATECTICYKEDKNHELIKIECYT